MADLHRLNPNSTEGEPQVFISYNQDDKSFNTWTKSSAQTRPRKVPRTREEIEEAYPIKAPKPSEPKVLPEETIALYTKAKSEPGSLSDEEILSLLEWVPTLQADEQCKEICGYTWEELINKAIDNPEDLTADEASFVRVGRKPKDKLLESMNFTMLRQPSHVVTLWHDAQRAADPRYAVAKENATREARRIGRHRKEALSHLSEEDTQSIEDSMRIPWTSELARDPQSQWGLVCFRTNFNEPEAWEKYKTHILHCSQTGFWARPGADRVAQKWKIQFIDDEQHKSQGPGIDTLCRYFKDPPKDSSVATAIMNGLRSDIFLLADAGAISSLNDPPSDPWPHSVTSAPEAPPRELDHLFRGHVKVVDASYNPLKDYAHGFRGVLKVHPAHLATTFYQRLLARNEEKGPERWWGYKQNIETMYKRAHEKSGREGGVYPPYSGDNY